MATFRANKGLLMAVSAAILALLTACNDLAQQEAVPGDKKPNIVIIFTDDQGYADLGVFGGTHVNTPRIDQMAREGMKFTDFVVSSAVCSASRAALMTGCYHRRVGISGALGPKSNNGIHDREMTLAEVCKQKNYATACFGKWHLGHHPKFLPLHQIHLYLT